MKHIGKNAQDWQVFVYLFIFLYSLDIFLLRHCIITNTDGDTQDVINSFQASFPFLYPLKLSEN